MAVTTMKIPVCDVCGEAWLPKKGPGREDPAKHCKRCGKCKNPHWNSGPREQRLRGRKIQPHPDGDGLGDLAEEVLEEVTDLSRLEKARMSGLQRIRPPRLCAHRLTNCIICHPEAASSRQ